MDISTMSALHTWCNISFTRFDPVSLFSLLSTCLDSSVAFFEKQRYNKGFLVRMWQIWIHFYQSDPVLWLSKQNLCFILPQFLYQFFCGYSQQVSASPRNPSLFVCLFVCSETLWTERRQASSLRLPLPPRTAPQCLQCDEACQAFLIMSFDCSNVMVVRVCMCVWTVTSSVASAFTFDYDKIEY